MEKNNAALNIRKSRSNGGYIAPQMNHRLSATTVDFNSQGIPGLSEISDQPILHQ